MSFEEEFDKAIKQKVEQASYPFDEANWQKASQMLDAQHKAAGVWRTPKFYLPVIALGVATIAFVMFNTGSNNGKVSDANLISSLKPTGSNQTINKHAAAAEPLQPETSADLNNNSTINNTNKVNDEDLAITLISQPDKDNASNKNNTSVVNTTKTTKNIIPAKISANTQMPGNVNNNNNTVLAAQLQEPKPYEISVTNQQAKVIPVSEPEIAMEPQNPAVISNHNTPIQSSIPVIAEPEETNTQELNNTGAALSFEYLTLINPVTESFNEELRLEPFVLLPRYDDDYYKKEHKHKTHFANVYAGANYNMGWQTATVNDGNGFNGYAGFNYGYYLSKKLALGAGFQAYNVGNTNQKFYEVVNKNYDFGYNQSGTSITSKNLVYISIPLNVYYNVNANNQLGLGFNPGYLVYAKSLVQTFKLQDGATLYNPAETTTGVYSCTQSFNYMLSAVYNRRLTKRIYASAEFVYGITDIFKNTTTIKNSEKPMGLRLSLQYTLFDK